MGSSRFADRMREKVQRENLWFFILVLLSKGERYGFELRKLINQEFGFWSGNVTAYRVLYAMERAGLVTAEVTDRRKYYRITEVGREELKEAETFLRGVVESAEGLGGLT